MKIGKKNYRTIKLESHLGFSSEDYVPMKLDDADSNSVLVVCILNDVSQKLCTGYYSFEDKIWYLSTPEDLILSSNQQFTWFYIEYSFPEDINKTSRTWYCPSCGVLYAKEVEECGECECPQILEVPSCSIEVEYHSDHIAREYLNKLIAEGHRNQCTEITTTRVFTFAERTAFDEYPYKFELYKTIDDPYFLKIILSSND